MIGTGRCIFVADVHVDASDPARADRFLDFLREEAPRCERLFLLGDLFDLWIGPRHEQLPDHAAFLREFADVVDGAAMKVTFLHGNRDFFVGGSFPVARSVEVAGSELSLDLGDRRVHVCHGDMLCTSDRGYR